MMEVPKNLLWQRFGIYLALVLAICAGIVYAGPERTVKANNTSGVPLVEAVREHESGGCEWKVGDKNLKNKAYTSLQIRQPALDDVNDRCQKEIKKLFGCRTLTIEYLEQNRVALDWVFSKYTGLYATRKRLGRAPTDEDRARIWNGGPNGWRDEDTIKSRNTRRYWKNVQACF